MARDRRRGRRLLPGLAVWVLILPAPLAAHGTHVAGQFRLTIGWAEEPAYAGSRNAVTVAVSDAAGNPVVDLGGGSLSVDVSFGSERTTLPLQPAWARRHEYRAWIVPTRSGTYTFHITGRIKSQPIDLTTTCSEKTFDCVGDASEIQFPAKDPSSADLASRIERSLPRADRALETASRAQTLAWSAIAAAGMALAAPIILGLRRRRKSP